MVLYILTGYRVLGIVYLNQPSGARHTLISYHNILIYFTCERNTNYNIDEQKNIIIQFFLWKSIPYNDAS